MLKILIFPALFAAASMLSAAPAPDFTITDSDGNVRHLYDDYVDQNKLVVLEIFFVNCPPCATHAPHWQSLYTTVKQKFPGRVEFIMLSDKSADNNAAVAQYKLSKSLTMPAAGSNGGSLSAVQPYENGQFGLFLGTPTFIIIKPGTGEVLFDVRGGSATSTMNLLSQKIDQILLPRCVVKTFKGDTLQNYDLTVSVPNGPSVKYAVGSAPFSLENFPGLPAAPFYLATPDKNDNPLNGVSTLDLVQINKQILAVEPFQYAWQFTAADANNSGSVTTFDIVDLRRLILGVYDTLPARRSWVFSPASDTISTSGCPDLTAIKTGDVNGSSQPAASGTALDRGDPLVFSTENILLETGQTYRLHIRANENLAVQGLQAAFRFDPSRISVRQVGSERLPDFDSDTRHLSDDRLSLSWFQTASASTVSDAPLFEIEVFALQNGPLSEAIFLEKAPLPAELYDTGGATRRVQWQWQEPAPGHTLWPNPATGRFYISLNAKNTPAARVVLFDVFGKSVCDQTLETPAGADRLEVRPGALPSGVYTVTVNGERAGKLIWH